MTPKKLPIDLRSHFSRFGPAESDAATESVAPASGMDALEIGLRSGVADRLRAELGVTRSIDAIRDDLSMGSEVPYVEAVALEAIILSVRTPVYRVKGDRPVIGSANGALQLDGLPKPLVDAMPAAVDSAAGVIRAVARVDLPERADRPFAGTAFLIGDGLMLTNRHVAALFCDGVGRVDRAPRYGARCRFGYEEPDIPGDEVTVERVEWIHPFWDAALLRVNGPTLADRAPLTFTGATPAGQSSIAVVGYPAKVATGDWYEDVQNSIFGGVYNVKRFQPGRAGAPLRLSVPRPDNAWMTMKRLVLPHDASTLGGNSGSVVYRLQDDKVLGLHFAGARDSTNMAVPARELLRDPLVRAAIRDATELPETPRPYWVRFWADAAGANNDQLEDGAETLASPTSAGAAPVVGSAGPQGFLARAIGPRWWVQPDLTALRALWALDANRAAMRAEIDAALGAGSGDLIRLLDVVASEAAADAPVIVYLHGIMGAHLQDTDNGARWWLDLLALPFTRVAGTLSLAPDGSDRPAVRISPAGHIDLAYGDAHRAWLARGFTVLPFAYDWRRPIPASADQLHGYLLGIRPVFAGRRLVLVAHSMGGVVTTTMAARHADWSTLLDGVCFVGSPLGGSLAPVQSVRGTYGTLRTLAGFGRDTLGDLQRMARTLPGLLGMLPDPALFADAERLYEADAWVSEPRPDAALLRAARALKDTLRTSPIYADPRVCAIVSGAYATRVTVDFDAGGPCAGAEGAGDGTVPLVAAAIPQLAGRLFHASGKTHGDLMKHRGVIDAVAQLARGEAITVLPAFTVPVAAPLGGPAGLESVVDSYAALGASIAEKVAAGTVERADLDALLNPDGVLFGAGAPPARDEAEVEPKPEPAGPAWVDRYPVDTRIASLEPLFRAQVGRFVAALAAAHAEPSAPGKEAEAAPIPVKLRSREPLERRWLMVGAWAVATGAPPPAPLPGVAIDWTCGNDPVRAKAAAAEMVRDFGLSAPPVMVCRASVGQSVLLTLYWTGARVLRDPVGIEVHVDAAEGTDENPVLHDFGARFGVIYAGGGRWSVDGR